MKLDQLVDELGAFLLAQNSTKPFVFGISGGQGAGKSTLCQALEKKLATQGKPPSPCRLMIFICPKRRGKNWPMTFTRYAPHAVCPARMMWRGWLRSWPILTALARQPPWPCRVFSKSHDDCVDEVQIRQRPDFVFLEGWCIGGHADCIEAVAQNDWEIEHDADALWKSWTREAARAYQPIWDKCNAIMLLRQEDFEAVIDSRWIQEQGNAAASGVWQFADRAEVAEFCAHYQSWTLGIWADLTPRADFVIGRTPSYDYYSMRG